MRSIRWTSLIGGAAAFLASHAIERAKWAAWFGGAAYDPWFLNSGRAAALTAGLVLVAGLVAGALGDRGDAATRGANVAAGAFAAMTATLFATGPGTIFPIVLAVCAAIAAAAGFGGAAVGAALLGRSRRAP